MGATELPPVNADDNGKVLGVSDGAWAKVAASGGSDLPDDPAQDGTYNLQNMVSSGTGTLSWASGGSSGGVLVVHLETTDGETWSSDKSRAEILTAMSNGPVFLSIGVGLGVLNKDPDYPEIYGAVITVEPALGGGGLLKNYYAEFAEDGTLSVIEATYSLDAYSE